MGLEDLTIEGAAGISPENKGSAFYVLDSYGHILVEELPNSDCMTAHLYCDKRTDDFFVRLNGMTKRLLKSYNKNISISLKKFMMKKVLFLPKAPIH